MVKTRAPHTKRRLSSPEKIARLLNLDTKKRPAGADGAPPPKQKPKMPAPPSNLNNLARARWKFMIVALADRLQPTDDTALALYCEAYADWQEAGVQLKKKNNGKVITHPDSKNKYRNPWADVQKSARNEMKHYMQLFGLSPHDRARLGIDSNRNPGGAEENEFDEFDR